MRAYADEDEAATLTAAAAVNDWGRYLKHAAENAAERERATTGQPAAGATYTYN